MGTQPPELSTGQIIFRSAAFIFLFFYGYHVLANASFWDDTQSEVAVSSSNEENQ